MAPAPRRILAPHRLPAHLGATLLLAAATLVLSSCGSFFTCEGKAACPVTCTATITTNCTGGTGTGGTGSSAVDYAYVANSSTANTSIDGYNLSAGALTAATGSPFALGYVPNAMVVSPANGFLYATSDPSLATGEIYGYSIGTGGALSKLGSGTPLIEENDAALALSPDGQWLFTLPTAALIVNVYPANASTGALSGLQSNFSLSSAPSGTITPLSVTVAPSGEYFAAALGTGGANVFPFNTTTGGQTTGQSGAIIYPGSVQNGVYALAFDSNNYLYAATTNGLQVFAVTSGITLTAVNTTPYPLGSAPRSIAIASTTTNSVTTPNFVYIGNEGNSTISAYAIGTNGALTAVSGSPFSGPTAVNSLSVDSTGKYLIASGYNASTGIQLFTISSTGALTSTATAGDGTVETIPGAIAATH